jgi:hypothetical protein
VEAGEPRACEFETWGRLSGAERETVEAEAGGLPLPGLDRAIEVVWEK